MKINNIDMQTQKDEPVRNQIMTYPVWQSSPDYFYQYGCLLTAKCNCYNLYFKDRSYKTLQQLNQEMIANLGYEYIFYQEMYKGDVEKQKSICFNRESYSRPETVNKILGIISEGRNYTGIIDVNSVRDYFIIKTQYKNTGHYSMIVNNDKKYLDSYDGLVKTPTPDIIQEIIKITFA